MLVAVAFEEQQRDGALVVSLAVMVTGGMEEGSPSDVHACCVLAAISTQSSMQIPTSGILRGLEAFLCQSAAQASIGSGIPHGVACAQTLNAGIRCT